MKTPSISSELSGGAGFTFEAHVAAYYLTTLVCEHTAPALGNRIVCPVALQQKAGGEPLDDVVVDAEANDMCRLRLQVKRSLIASSALTNTDFAEVVVNSLRTIMKEDFREGVDRVGAATEFMTENSLREVMRVCDISRAVSTSTAFFALVAGDALSVNSTKTLSIFRDIVQRVDGICSDESLYKILRHFVIVKLSLLDGAATDVPQAINQLRVVLPSSNSGQAPNLWSRLLAIAHDGAARFAVIDRRALLLALVPDFRFSASLLIRQFCCLVICAITKFLARNVLRASKANPR